MLTEIFNQQYKSWWWATNLNFQIIVWGKTETCARYYKTQRKGGRVEGKEEGGGREREWCAY
jgi:hypothetical protein